MISEIFPCKNAAEGEGRKGEISLEFLLMISSWQFSNNLKDKNKLGCDNGSSISHLLLDQGERKLMREKTRLLRTSLSY